MITELNLTHEGQVSRVAAHGNCIINVWGTATTEGISVARMRRALEAFTATTKQVAAQHSKIAFLVVLERGAPLLDSETRHEIDLVYRRWGPKLCAVAQVVEGNSIWASSARGMMTALRLVERRPYPVRLFDQIERGAAFLGPHLEAPACTAATLADTAAALRA